MDMRVRKAHPMPEVAAFVAAMRAEFGSGIDDAIARGKRGEPTFFASENGRTVGTRIPSDGNVIPLGEAARERRYCQGCDGSCVGTLSHCRD
jgi:hypothetical protein